jgi:hypothetical protein
MPFPALFNTILTTYTNYKVNKAYDKAADLVQFSFRGDLLNFTQYRQRSFEQRTKVLSRVGNQGFIIYCGAAFIGSLEVVKLFSN